MMHHSQIIQGQHDDNTTESGSNHFLIAPMNGFYPSGKNDYVPLFHRYPIDN